MSDLSVKSAVWLKSSYSVGMNNCVETARLSPGLLAVRDSKNTAGPALMFPPSAWSAFVEDLCHGDLGDPGSGGASRP